MRKFTNPPIFRWRAAVLAIVLVLAIAVVPAVADSPIADFTAVPTTGNAPLAVQFTDGSTGENITGWAWDFDNNGAIDNTTSNPSYTYVVAGSYSVNLTVTNSSGSNSTLKTEYITVNAAPAALFANFTANVTSGTVPLPVQFTDESTGAPTTWLWNFGDGTNSTDKNATHTYSAPGNYTVNLTVGNAGGSDSEVKTDYITVNAGSSAVPAVSFAVSQRTGIAPLTVLFTDNSTQSPTSWLWNFGDGNTSTEQNPTHTYSSVGIYTVNVSATNSAGTGSLSRPGFITVLTPGLLPSNRHIFINVANDAGVKYDLDGATYGGPPNTYYIKADGGGLNALSIDQLTTTTNTSGTFNVIDGGGAGGSQEFLILLAVQDPVPDDFSATIRSNGIDTQTGTYVTGAVNETFTKDDFYYGQHIYRPGPGTLDVWSLPLYFDQNTSDPSTASYLAFIDLNVGGTTGNVEFSFNNLTTLASFSFYAWRSGGNQGQGISWTNSPGSSGYKVIGIPAAPIANFTSSTATPDIASPVQFTDLSTNVPQSWLWDFGDGSTSTEQNPVHTYTAAGTFTVNLTVTNTKGTDTMVKTDYIIKEISAVPVANFTVNVVSGTSPVPVRFTDQSTGTISSRSWDFGDGTTSTSLNPVHCYVPGTYTVNLTVTNSAGSNSYLKDVTVNTAEPHVIKDWTFESGTVEDFTAVTTWKTWGNVVASVSPTAHGGNYSLQVSSGGVAMGYAEAPLIVHDANYYRVEYWVWSSNIGYGYTNVGISVVDADGALIAGMTGNDNTIADTDGTTLCNRPAAAWVRHVIGWEKDTGVIDHFAYDMNGTLMGSRQITRAASAGKTPATVWCNVRGYNGEHIVRYDDIRVSSDTDWEAPTAAFISDVQTGTVPQTIQFTDLSVNAPTSWNWDFGDGANSTEKNPVHTYNTIGTYTVNLTVTNPSGSDSEEKTGFITITIATIPPVAAFNATPTSGIVPVFVQFTDQSAEKPTSWFWDFGDGANSTMQNASHNYMTAGNYTVKLTATNGAGSDDEIKTDYITVIPTSADFTADTTAGPAPLTVHFTDHSIGSPTSWTWDFGDGANSTEQNPTHIFYTFGNYTVNLTATNPAGSYSVSKTDFITVSSAVADFTVDTTAGPAPLTVHFTDTTTGSPTSWVWDFGDGANSTEKNPIHVYNTVGNFTVNLTASNPSGNYSVTRIDLIAVSPTIAPVASFTPSATNGATPFFVRFTDTSANYPISWAWDFGDGATSTTRNATHTYMVAGTYTVNLTVTNAAGSDDATTIITVATGSGGNGTIANSAWPKFQLDGRNTGQSPYAGPEAGTIVWDYTMGGGVSYAGPSIGANGTIYIGSYDSKLYALHPDGILQWSYTTGSRIYGSPAIAADGTIYVGSYDNKLYAINPDGTLQWSYTTGSRIYGSPAIAADGTIYVGSYDKNLYAINPDGTLKWSYTAGSYFYYTAPAIGPDGTIYIGNYDSKLYALNADGTLKWSYTTGSRIYGAPAIGPDGTIYVGSYDKNLYAINPDGTLKWSYATGNYIYGSPALATDGTIYIGSYNGMLYALNPDGTLKWSFTTGARIYGAPALSADGGIFVGSYDKNIYAINSDGSLRWSYTTGNYIYGSPAIGSDGTLYIGSYDGKLYAFRTDHVAPVANFTSSTANADLLSPVQFTDTSANYPTSWAWDFGDGTVSIERNPTHTYTLPGIYTVTLTVTNAQGTDNEVKTGHITKEISAVPVANFMTDVFSGVFLVPVKCTDQSTGTIITHFWDFGDGTNSTEQNPAHLYAPGNYTIGLTVTNSGGSNSTQKTVTVTASGEGWTFESGSEEGFTPVNTWGNGMTLSVSNTTAHGGVYALECFANNGIGYAKASLGNVPDAKTYGVDYWVRSSNVGYGYTNVGISVVDSTGALIVKIDGSDNDVRDSAHNVFISSRLAGVWLHHVIKWEKDTGLIDHFVYDENGVLLGSRQITRAETVGKIPFEIWCNVRGYSVAHTIQYDDITFTAGSAVSVVPNTSALPPGSSTEYQLVMNTLPAGLSGYNITVSLDHPAVGEITAVSLPTWAALNGTSTLPADTVSFNAVDLNKQVEPGAANVLLGTVTVRADTAGTTGINVTVRKMDDDNGDVLGPAINDGQLQVFDPLVANFSAEPLSGYRPLTVNFTDLSTGNPLPNAWAWDFENDGIIDSSTQSPSYTYAAAGTYTVNLTISNEYDTDSVVKATFVEVEVLVQAFPGYTNLPTDPDHDGIFEDVNGNGRLDFDDVVAYYSNMAWMNANEAVGIAPYDFNNNGRIDFDDVVVLYDEVLAG